jgi:IS5 family transposase
MPSTAGRIKQGRPGETCPSGLVHGRPSTTIFRNGELRACTIASSKPSTSGSMPMERSTGNFLWCIDGSSIRASRAAVGASKKPAVAARKSRKTALWAAREPDSAANSTWLLTVEVAAGQTHESTCVDSVMDQIAIPQPLGRPRERPRRLSGDKGYSSNRVRDWLWKHGIKPLILPKENENLRHDGRSVFDKQAQGGCSIVEQAIGWLKGCRRIGTRFKKLAINFLAIVKFTMSQRCLEMAFSERASSQMRCAREIEQAE